MSKQNQQTLIETISHGATLNDLLDEKQAAFLLKVTPRTLSVWRSTGRYSLPFIKVGRSVRYRLADLNKWIETRSCNNGATA